MNPITEQLTDSIALQTAKLRAKLDEAKQEHALACAMLSRMCSGYESFFESDESFLSDEDINDYVKAAKYLQYQIGRSDGGLIRRMEDKRDGLRF